jgi:hypothetical protein
VNEIRETPQVTPKPDPRWELFTAGATPGGPVRPMSFEALEKLASEWEEFVPTGPGTEGPASLLRAARSLFKHSWFDYEFMPIACLLGFQALEAAFRVLYTEDGHPRFRELVDRAIREELLPPNIGDVARTAVELRNLFSHPAMHTAFTLRMAAPMLENTHRLTGVVLAAALRG